MGKEKAVGLALKMVASGASVAEAALACGISRSAVYQAKNLRAKKTGRVCSECGAALSPEVRKGAVTCSGSCRVKRSCRLKAEKADRLAAEVERLKAGMRRAAAE